MPFVFDRRIPHIVPVRVGSTEPLDPHCRTTNIRILIQGSGNQNLVRAISFFKTLKHERDSLHEKFVKDGRRNSRKPNPIQQGVAGVGALEADPREESEPRQVSVGQESGVIHL